VNPQTAQKLRPLEPELVMYLTGEPFQLEAVYLLAWRLWLTPDESEDVLRYHAIELFGDKHPLPPIIIPRVS
jgi:hypothetical protein